MALDKNLVAITVRITVTHDNSASCGHNTVIIITVPIIVNTPENIELNDCETVVDIFSISLVIRLIISPWLLLSRDLTGRLTMCLNKSSLIFFTIFWLNTALILVCKNVHILCIMYTTTIVISIGVNSLNLPEAIISIALL